MFRFFKSKKEKKIEQHRIDATRIIVEVRKSWIEFYSAAKINMPDKSLSWIMNNFLYGVFKYIQEKESEFSKEWWLIAKQAIEKSETHEETLLSITFLEVMDKMTTKKG